MTAFSLSRRTLLRGAIGGASVAVGLPLLEAMLDAHGEALADGSSLPRQFVTWLACSGFLLSRFEPQTAGPDWEITEQLQPLSVHKPYVNVCTGYTNHGQTEPTLFGHVEGVCAYSGYPAVFEEELVRAGGPSIDQVVADYYAERVSLPVRSVQVGISKSQTLGVVGDVGGGMSFRGEPGNVTLLPPIHSPRALWQSLFGFLPLPEAPAEDRMLRASVLDVVRGQAQRLRPRLGTHDRQRMDAHLDGIYELEQKILAVPSACTLPDQPDEENDAPVGAELVSTVNQLMAELVAYALHCDITRVASVQLLGVAGDTPWSEIGQPTTQHFLSHDAQFSSESLEHYHAGSVYEIQKLADLVDVFRNTVNARGDNLLDTSIIFASSDVSIGWSHSIRRHPILLIGTGGGHLRSPGIHAQAIPNDPDDPDGYAGPDLPSAGNTSDILLSVLQAFDSSATSIGGGQAQSVTALTDILA